MKKFTLECKTHEIATNLTSFLNSIPNIKAKDLGGQVRIIFKEKKKEKKKEESTLEHTEP